MLVFRKEVARRCSLTKKVAQNPKSCQKVAEQNLERPSYEVRDVARVAGQPRECQGRQLLFRKG